MVTSGKIIDTKTRLENLLVQGTGVAFAPQTIQDAINLLQELLEESRQVVDSCLRGHSQHAEEFAYQLSGA